ncbi:MAG: 50S ribosomal protein L6 [Candidatus Altarchaeaceae archaeon]
MEERIKIPEGNSVEILNGTITVKGKYGKVERKFNPYFINIYVENNEIVLKTKKDKRRDKALLYTMVAHIKNMFHGVNDKIIYKLKLVYSHFPVSLEVKGNELLIKNFLGEKVPRRAKILDGVSCKISGKDIILEGVDIEKVSQTAANMEIATKVTKRDRRVFQDGIYITEKDGVPIV